MYYLGSRLWQIRLLIIYEQSSPLSLPCGRAEWWKHSGGRAEDDHLDGIFRSLLMAPHIILSLPHCHETATSSFFQPTMEPKCFWSRISIYQAEHSGGSIVAEKQKMIILMASFGLFLWPHILFSLCHTATKQPQAPSFSPQWSQNVFEVEFQFFSSFSQYCSFLVSRSGAVGWTRHLDCIFRSLLMAPHIILSLPYCHETATSSFFQPTMEQKYFWIHISTSFSQ